MKHEYHHKWYELKKEYKFIGLGLLSEDASSFDMSNPEESFYKQFNLNKKELEEKYNLC